MYYLRRLGESIKAYWENLITNMRLKRWPVTDEGADNLSRMKQKLERLFSRSK